MDPYRSTPAGVAEFVAYRRRLRALSIAELAELAEVSVATVTRFEDGDVSVSWADAIKILAALDINVPAIVHLPVATGRISDEMLTRAALGKGLARRG